MTTREIDMRGYLDSGPICDTCGVCDCELPCNIKSYDEEHPYGDCIGLAHYFVCMDGGDTLCPPCHEKLARR